MIKKRQKTIFFIVLMLMLITCVSSQIYLGIAQGIIFDPAGATVPGATVGVEVTGCTGGEDSGCIGSAISQSNGFFIIANLNINSGDQVILTANYSLMQGNAMASADSSQFIYQNITIAALPIPPALTAEPDTTNTSVILEWINGSDQNTPPLSLFHEFRIDYGSFGNQSSSVNMTNLSIGSHTWDVRACNNYECSSTQSDTFLIINDPPTAPTVQNISDSSNTSAVFNWT